MPADITSPLKKFVLVSRLIQKLEVAVESVCSFVCSADLALVVDT
jgi:hypothetical protein